MTTQKDKERKIANWEAQRVKIQQACRDLPPRKPRGHPQNELRALMFPYLLAGMSPEEAKKKAIDRAKALLEGILLLEKEGL